LTSASEGVATDAIEPIVRPPLEDDTSMSTFRLVGFAGLLVVAALVGGTIIGSVAAATITRTPQAEGATLPPPAAASASPVVAAAGEYCADFRRAFAANLDVEESALAPAAKAAAISAIDAAVADGTMTVAAGDRLKARIRAAAADGCALLAGRLRAAKAAVGARVGAGLGVVKDGLTAAAKALGLTPAELGARLRGGETLKDVAATTGTSYEAVSAAVLGAVKADLDAAVAAGTIRQARADRVLDRLTKALADGRLRNDRPAPAGSPAATPAPASGS
jgi:ribosomal protein S20